MTVDTQEFLETIFSDVVDGETVLIAKQTKRGFAHVPARSPKLSRWLGRSALYFNISTVVDQDPLRRRSDDCRAVYCMVLDDIGSKVDEPPVPPSWILETSEGSFQWGYLITPTEELDRFAALMDAIADAGLTDGGAKGFNRLMRIPGSINTKPGKNGFEAHIVEWAPERVFETLDQVAEAFDVQIGVVIPKDRTKTANRIELDDIDVADPIVDFLSDNDMVADDDGEWLTIECPNCDTHTTGDDTARYSPLGRGDGDYKYTRGFKCFHEHCKDFSFLDWVANNGGPFVRAYDPLPFLRQRYVYVASGRRVCDLQALAVGGHYDMAVEEFSDMFAYVNVHMPTIDKPKRTLSGKAAFLADDQTTRCVSYQTVPYARSERGRGGVEPGFGDQLIINTYRPPEHGVAPRNLDVFLEHVQFLLPHGDDCMVFLDWLAYKLQNPRTRSFGVVMVAEDTFGVGRSWLGDVLRAVWGTSNVASIDIGDLTGHGHSAGYNDWASGSQLVVIEEAHDGSDQTHYRAYERIKTLIDPRVTTMQINTKYGAKREEDIWFNLLVFSNHIDAFNLPVGERRLAVFENPRQKQDEDYYTRLWKAYNEDSAGLAAAIYEFLSERDISKFNPAVPPVTEAKERMVENSAAPSDIMAAAIIERAKGELVTKNMLFDLFEQAEQTEHLENTLSNSIRRRLVMKLWQQLPRLKETANRNGFRSRARSTVPEEIRALRRADWWIEHIEDFGLEELKAELAKTAGGIGEEQHTVEGAVRI